jgi:hypothetical protein
MLKTNQWGGHVADQRRKAAKKQRRAKRLADRAQRFEQHTRLAAERAGDPRFVQRTWNADGSSTIVFPDHDREIKDAFAEQEAAFRAKFGRDMGPEDPVFFDPDADEPVPMTPEKISAQIREAAEDMPDAQSRAYMLAYADLGYIITEQNQHTFTAHEVEAFFDAVEQHMT